MTGVVTPCHRRGRTASSRFFGKRASSVIVAALVVTSSGSCWLYLRILREQQAAQRRKLREQLRQGASAASNGGSGAGSAAADVADKAVKPRKTMASGLALQQLLKMLLKIAGPKILALVALAFARTALSNRLARLQGHLFRAAFLKKVPLFMQNITENVMLCLAASAIEATSKRMLRLMDLQWQRTVTSLVHKKYFENMTYYKLPYVDQSITNPEQRICEDIPKLTGGCAELIRDWIVNSIDAVFYWWQLRAYTGSNKYSLAILGYVMAAGVATSVFAPSFGSLYKKEQELEGGYRQLQARLRENAEPIAFYGGIEREGALVKTRFTELMRHRMRMLRTQLRHSIVQDFFLKYLAGTFAVVMIIGPFFGGKMQPKDNIMGRARMLSDMRYHTSVIINLFTSTGVLASSSKKFARLSAYAGRIQELTDASKRLALDTTQARTRGNILTCEDAIVFEDVEVVTPAGATLVKDLSLRVPRGTNLLVTGPNGSGKSSLFRVLGGLWPLSAGKVHKPGGSGSVGLSNTIFYVPQRPYVTVGTLLEQIVYPAEVTPGDQEAVLGKDALRELLAAVDLEYLLEREGMDQRVNWHDTLSLGEQQRLGMARLFYHKPDFAILDECTSGVTIDMEQRFCNRVKAQGCTCITISHRPALMAFHDMVLNLDGLGNWSIRRNSHHGGHHSAKDVEAPDHHTSHEGSDDDKSQAVVAVSDSSSDLERNDDIIARAPPRDARDRAALKDCRPVLPVQSSLQRWKAVGALLLGGSKAKARLGMISVVVLLRTLLQDRIARLNGRSVDYVLRQDRPAFVRLIGLSVLQSAASSVLAPLLKYLADALALSWRDRLTVVAHRRYLKGSTCYAASNLAGMQDVDQRVTKDLERLTADIAELLPTLVKPLIDFAWFSSQLWALTGVRGSASLYLYAALGFGCLRAVTPDFGSMADKQYSLEGAFRRLHVRLRIHAESVAFFGGGEREGRSVSTAFNSLQAHQNQVSRVRYPYALADDFFTKQLPNNVTWLLTLMYSLSQTGDFSKTEVQGQLVRDMRYLASVVTQCFSAFGELLGMQKRCVELDGGILRVVGLLETLKAADALQAAATMDRARHVSDGGDQGDIEIEEVDVAPPGGRVLARRLTVHVRRGEGLLITGPNGSGKSSLMRLLGGLWPLPSGRMALPAHDTSAGLGRQDIFYVPQKPYTTVGTLRDQVIYPLSQLDAASRQSNETEAQALERLDADLDDLMTVVKLENLIEREGGWNAVASWGDTMSLGEQQRIGMARLFFHRPAFGVLDECTNATSADVEETLYEHAEELGITLITITQRTALTRFHAAELELSDGQGEWVLRRLREVTTPSPAVLQQ